MRSIANKSKTNHTLPLSIQNSRNPARVIDNRLRIKKSSLKDFLIFNPIEVIKFPFVDTRDDKYRRRAFLEYFFRTAFFGQFKGPNNLTNHARLIMLLAMLAFPLLLIQLVRTRQNFPCALFVVCGFTGVLYFRSRFAIAPAQDFRYFAHAAPAAIVLLSSGTIVFKEKYIRSIYLVMLYLLGLLQATFIIRQCFDDSIL